MTTSPTAEPHAHAIRFSNPDELVAAIPHLVGFPPHRSVVLVGVALDAQGRPATLRLTQRFDLPPPGMRTEDLHGMAVQAAEPMVRSGSQVVFAAVFGDRAPSDAEPPGTRLVDELTVALDEAGAPVADAFYTDGTSRWTYGCTDPTCCPPEGRVIPDEVRTRVAAEFVRAGAAMVTDRDAIVAEVAPATDQEIAAVSDLIASAGPPPRARAEREAFRDDALVGLNQLASGVTPTPAETARALVGLTDIRVRDTALWDLMDTAVDTRAATSGLAAMVRAAPAGYVAPAATILAVLRWTQGEGARANVALERAQADDFAYPLATLVETGLRVGLPPSSWREAMSGLTREELRYGREHPATPATAAPSPTPFPMPPRMPSLTD